MEHFNQFVYNHWQLCVAFVVIFIVIFIYESLALKKQGKSITPDEAVEWMNNRQAIVVDLRGPDLFKQGHIIDSIRASEADFDTAKMSKYKEKTLILVCAQGTQSSALGTKLRAKGFTQPFVLAGGISGWQAANMPLVKK